MYIKNLKFQNYGPISNLDVTPNFRENGNPKPIVFIGKNGSGKTLLLGNILDGLIELKRQKFNDLLEVEQNKYLKVGKKDYIKNGDRKSTRLNSSHVATSNAAFCLIKKTTPS